MAQTIQTIGIANGGGDCPGLNAVIRGVVRSAILGHEWQVIGIQDGFDFETMGGSTSELITTCLAVGRFDVRLATGARPMPTEPEPFDPLPTRSPK